MTTFQRARYGRARRPEHRQQHTAHVLSRGSRAGAASLRSKNAQRHSARRCLVSSNRNPVPAPSGIVSAAPTLKRSSNRLSSLNCWRLSVPRYLSCLYALRAANIFKMGARTRSARMPPCDRLLHAVTMPAAIGTERFLLIGVASLLHAKAIGTPLSKNTHNTLGLVL